MLARVVPASFKGNVDDVAELLNMVDNLWAGVEILYQKAMSRVPTEIERKRLNAHAMEVLRAG